MIRAGQDRVPEDGARLYACADALPELGRETASPPAAPGRRALRAPDNIALLTLPPYAPEINLVENVWEHLRKNKLAVRRYDTYEAIVAAC